MKSKARWTFMVYMAGDNSLSSAGDADLAEMRTVGSSDIVNCVVQFDNAGPNGTRRYRIHRDGIGEETIMLEETDSGSSEVLLDFVRWAVNEYPAERYVLVLWNHGGGWAPTEIERIAANVGSVGFDDREAVERSSSPLGHAFFRSTLERILSLQSAGERAICSDDGSCHSLDTLELGRVMRCIAELLGRPLDLLGMDACLMSNLEVAYQLRDHVAYIVASEETEPAQGWPYQHIVRLIVNDPEITTAELASKLVRLYIVSYSGGTTSKNVTQSALSLAAIHSLVAPLDELAGALCAEGAAVASVVWNSQRATQHFFSGTLWDIGDLGVNLKHHAISEAVRVAAQRTVEHLTPGPTNLVLAESHIGPKVQRCTGISIYMPSIESMSQFYDELDFARDHGWSQLLHTLSA